MIIHSIKFFRKLFFFQTSYFCHANNTLGEAVKELKVHLLIIKKHRFVKKSTSLSWSHQNYDHGDQYIFFRWMSQQCHCPSSMFLPVALLTMSQKTAGHFLKIIITLINIVKITFAFHMINNIFTIINKNINVSRDVCTLSIDLDLLARRPSCLPQFHQVCFHLVTFIIFLFKKFPVIFKEYFI